MPAWAPAHSLPSLHLITFGFSFDFFSRELNRLDNAKGAKATDALLNYETVKYFGNEALERRNFAEVSTPVLCWCL